jgi:hypothetical protein
MTKSGSECSERYAGITARRFDDGVTGMNLAAGVRFPEHVQRNPILDTPREVELFTLRVDTWRFPRNSAWTPNKGVFPTK